MAIMMFQKFEAIYKFTAKVLRLPHVMYLIGWSILLHMPTNIGELPISVTLTNSTKIRGSIALLLWIKKKVKI